MAVQTINPTTGQVIKTYPLMSEAEINTIIEATHQAYKTWRKSDFVLRKKLMLKFKELLSERKEEFANLMTDEMGKPITQVYAEIDKCIFLCEYFAENAETFLAAKEIKTEHAKTYVAYESLGIIFSIMPWNFPLWQVLRFLIPNLMAGNATILRHADCTTGSGFLVEKLVRDAGYPENLMRSVVIDNEMAAKIIAHPRIIGVTLTGSERAGKSVASEAGKALKKVVLELGGSDPYLILEDADLELAADICVKNRLANAGQVCVSPKRFIVVEKIAEQFTKLTIEKAKKFISGNPHNESCNLGPMARSDLRNNLHKQVQECVEKGAKLLLGGEMPQGEGFYYPATVLTNIKPGMPAYDDELFGPVITIISAKDEADAIKIANSVRFGLGSGVFTQDKIKGEKIARDDLESGMSAVNTAVASDPRLPFGGVKSSGFGRELSSFGIHEFVNVKTIIIS